MIIKILAVLGKVLLCLLALVLWVVMIPRSFWVEYTTKDKVCLWVRLIFFKVKIYPLPKLPSFKKEEKKPSREPKSEGNQRKKPNISEDLQFSFDLVKQTVSAFKGLMKRVLKAIKFKDISFSYDGKREVLKHVNLTVPKGKTIALVGQSGSGKSTLVDLLPRYHDVQEGDITIDGTSIRDVRIADLRQSLRCCRSVQYEGYRR